MQRYSRSTVCAGLLLLAAGAVDAAAQESPSPPRIQSVNVVGAGRTRPGIVVDLTGMSRGGRLTGRERELAERRLQQLPIARRATLRYVLDDDGQAQVQAIVDEKDMLPLDVMDFSGIAARAILKDEIKFDIAGPFRRGEVWSAAWRWSENRPRITAGVALPAPGILPGVLSVDALVEEATYSSTSLEPADSLVREKRQRGAIYLSDWITPELRWRGGAALDRIAGQRYAAVEGALDVRLVEDLVAPGVSVGAWRPIAGAGAFTVTDASVAWRSDRSAIPPFAGLLGVTIASGAAPFAVWPSAGTGGSGRGALLRAHPLHERGIVTSENFARRLMYFTFEHQRPLGFGPEGKTAMVVFLDAGRAWDGLPGRPRRVNVDIGTGVRFGSGSGTVRLEVGYGLRDQQWAVSAGWVDLWPWR